MKVKWLGHASFLFTSQTGLKIITDPYSIGSGLSYGAIEETADIVTISHDHFDHNNVAAVKGKPEVVKGAGKVKGIEFKAIPCYHDQSKGKERGNNTILCFTLDRLRICHLGDLGHPLSPQQIAEIGEVDLLLIPVGGFFTINASVATQICQGLKPKVTIPMHFKTPKCGFPISGVEDFTQGKTNVKKLEISQVEIHAEALPPTPEIWVLNPAL
jgi:L-ascorbate metabolism protein UlaG (beta-lactamase superfamily)